METSGRSNVVLASNRSRTKKTHIVTTQPKAGVGNNEGEPDTPDASDPNAKSPGKTSES